MAAEATRTIAGVISRVHSFVLQRIDAVPCEVEADVGYAETRKTTIVGMLNGRCEMEPHPPVDIESLIAEAKPAVDFGEVRGQEAVKRAITIAAAGAHSLLMIGPAGTGRTMSVGGFRAENGSAPVATMSQLPTVIQSLISFRSTALVPEPVPG